MAENEKPPISEAEMMNSPKGIDFLLGMAEQTGMDTPQFEQAFAFVSEDVMTQLAEGGTNISDLAEIKTALQMRGITVTANMEALILHKIEEHSVGKGGGDEKEAEKEREREREKKENAKTESPQSLAEALVKEGIDEMPVLPDDPQPPKKPGDDLKLHAGKTHSQQLEEDLSKNEGISPSAKV